MSDLPKRDVYAETTTRIIADLEQGVAPWRQAFTLTQPGVPIMPSNLLTKRPYNGSNTVMLWCNAVHNRYPTHQWATFEQVKHMGARVRKGEKAQTILFTKWVEELKEGQLERRPVVKYYSVFNRAQLDGLSDEHTKHHAVVDTDSATRQARIMMENCGVPFYYGTSRNPLYNAVKDEIHMPGLLAYSSKDAFYLDAFHELGHASGHESRLKRTFGRKYGNEEYAFEELVAELSAAFTIARMGMPYEKTSAQYLAGWLKIMKGDNKAIFRASTFASQSADFWFERCFEVKQENTPDIEAELAA